MSDIFYSDRLPSYSFHLLVLDKRLNNPVTETYSKQATSPHVTSSRHQEAQYVLRAWHSSAFNGKPWQVTRHGRQQTTNKAEGRQQFTQSALLCLSKEEDQDICNPCQNTIEICGKIPALMTSSRTWPAGFDMTRARNTPRDILMVI